MDDRITAGTRPTTSVSPGRPADPDAPAASRARALAILSALAAAALGLVLVCGAGLAPMEAIHNAAHDARHAAGFPCH